MLRDEYYYINIRNKLLRFTASAAMGRREAALINHAESFFSSFISLLYNINADHGNAETHVSTNGIDIVEHNMNLLFEISFVFTHSKIQHCLDRIPVNYQNGYQFIFLAITERAPHYRKPFIVPSGINFNPETDIFDITRLLVEVSSSPIEKLKKLSDLCTSFSFAEADEQHDDLQVFTSLQNKIDYNQVLRQPELQKIIDEPEKKVEGAPSPNIIDPSKTPILFSVGTKKAYDINSRYYNGLHYVWCAPFFNDQLQPPTSNPYSIYAVLQDIILHGDIHAKEIKDNKAGLLRGASARKKQGIITLKTRRLINSDVNEDTDVDHFFPVIYVIPVERLKDYEKRCEKQPKQKCASSNSEEYVIQDLKPGEFYLIDFTATLGRIPHANMINHVSAL